MFETERFMATGKTAVTVSNDELVNKTRPKSHVSKSASETSAVMVTV